MLSVQENAGGVEYRDVPGYEGLYVASSDGDIIGVKSGKVLTPSYLRGYARLKLFKEASGRCFLVHRIIASAFIANPEDKDEVNHINGIKHDNRVSNLEWVSHSENMLHASKHGLLNSSAGWKKECKKVAALDVDGLVVMTFDSQGEAARTLGVNRSSISNVCHGRGKTAGGYQWRLVSDL